MTVSSNLYDWYEQESITAYKSRDYVRGIKLCDLVLHSYAAPESTRVRAAYGMLKHVQPLPNILDFQIPIPSETLEPDYVAGNSAILPVDKGYMMINRLSNYQILPAAFRPEQIHTKNIWTYLNSALMVLWQQEIDHELVERLSYHPLHRMKITGLEDARFFEWQDRWWFIAGSHHFERSHKGYEYWGQVLCRVSTDGTTIDYIRPLIYPKRHRVEKNWLPFVQNDMLYLIYGYTPLVILRVSHHTGLCLEVHRQIQPIRMDNERGSGTPIPWEYGWLFSTHRVIRTADHKYVYLHRFMKLDTQFNITHLTNPFIFRKKGVEYSCGHCISHDGQRMLITYSSEDREARLLSVPLDSIVSRLHPLEEFQLDMEAV